MTDWLRDAIERELVVETEGWAAERVARVSDELQRDIAPDERLAVLVVWVDNCAAFTAGRTVYVERRFLERCPDDDTVAFFIGHEIAHHRLGHVPRPSRLWPVRELLSRFAHAMHGPERERDADLLAIELCLAAGYSPERCLHAFALSRDQCADYGDLDGAFGASADQARGRVHRWLSQRRRGYFSLAERERAVRDHLRALGHEPARTCCLCGVPGQLHCAGCERWFCERHLRELCTRCRIDQLLATEDAEREPAPTEPRPDQAPRRPGRGLLAFGAVAVFGGLVARFGITVGAIAFATIMGVLLVIARVAPDHHAV
jgi:hypothetical protein